MLIVFAETISRMKPNRRNLVRGVRSLGLGLALAFPVSEMSAGEYSAKTHYYAIEFLKPVQGTADVSILNITLSRRFDPQTTERVLREELARAVALFPPKGEVMAYAWFHSPTSPIS
jgi:hypothetical protein